MYKSGLKKGTIRFSLVSERSVRSVSLAGTFSDWRLVTMKKQKDGSHMVTVPVAAGMHEYKFLVDGQWVVDPDHSAWTPNPYGTLNSIVQAE